MLGGWIPIRLLVSGVFVFALIGAALVPALAGELGGANHVAGGVSVLGRDLGHLKRDELVPALKSAFADFARQPFQVRHNSAAITLTAADIGAAIDLSASAERILAAGEEDSFGDRLNRLIGRDPSRVIAPVITVDQKLLESSLLPLARAVDEPSRDAQLAIDPTGVKIRPAQPGRRLDLASTGRRIAENVTLGTVGVVSADVSPVAPLIADGDWQSAALGARAITNGQLTIRDGQRSWTLSAADLARMIQPDPPRSAGQAGGVRWNEEELRAAVTKIAREVDAQPTEASVARKDGKFQVVADVAGKQVDIKATIEAIEQAAEGVTREAALVATTVPPPVAVADWQQATELANLAVSSPLKLTQGDRQWSISGADLTNAITFTHTEGTASRFTVRLDPEPIRAVLVDIAKQVQKTAVEARFRMVGDKATPVAMPQDGQELDVEATLAQVARQAFSEQRVVPLAIKTTKAKIVPAELEKLSFPDLLAESVTSYAGSISERAHNVELATGRLNGTLVPPGAVFSFNESVGPTTLRAGYKIGYGITVKDGQAVTIPSEAGGICQVSSTLFHTVFWSGLPIVQRSNHIYWISRYVARGYVGLDATVDDPWLDLKFRNTTGDWLLIESSTDGANVRFALRGKKTGWEVKVQPPVITSVVKASPDPVRQEDASMPAGFELWIEHAEDGFTSRLQRTVLKDGKVIDSVDVVSRYLPSRNVLLVGTKGATPTPAASAVPAAAAPAQAATPVPGAAATPVPPASTPGPVGTGTPASR